MSPVRCNDLETEASAFLDAALAPHRQHEVEQHIATCPSCLHLIEDYRQIGGALKRDAYQRVPMGLTEILRADIAREAAMSPRRAPAPPWLDYARYAASIVIVAAISTWAGWLASERAHKRSDSELGALSAHMRSLLQETPTQVASSDRHTVRPWFAGRLEFAPTVQDLAAQGFPLQGARLDVIGDKRAAALVYKRRLHVINVFVWPADGAPESGPRSSSQKGYNLLAWTRAGMQYMAVSDLNAAELKELQALF